MLPSPSPPVAPALPRLPPGASAPTSLRPPHPRPRPPPPAAAAAAGPLPSPPPRPPRRHGGPHPGSHIFRCRALPPSLRPAYSVLALLSRLPLSFFGRAAAAYALGTVTYHTFTALPSQAAFTHLTRATSAYREERSSPYGAVPQELFFLSYMSQAAAAELFSVRMTFVRAKQRAAAHAQPRLLPWQSRQPTHPTRIAPLAVTPALL
jgi:hypothetical protein